jgi:c-di-GMP-binding flagellar brake protein YcgR
MPMEKTKLILLPIDGSFDLCFYTDSGLYQCFAKVIDRYKSNNVYVVVMELTSNLRKFQRREYYRFSCGLEMHSRQMEPEEIKAIDQNEFYIAPGLPVKRSLIINISGVMM